MRFGRMLSLKRQVENPTPPPTPTFCIEFNTHVSHPLRMPTQCQQIELSTIKRRAVCKAVMTVVLLNAHSRAISALHRQCDQTGEHR